jgi:vancomycin resistance protein YoaR
MTSRLYFYYFLLALCILLLLPINSVKAFSVFLDQQEISIPSAVLDDWLGQGALPEQSIIETHIDQEEIIAEYLGLAYTKPPAQKIYAYRPGKIYAFLLTLAKTLPNAKTEPKLIINDHFRAEEFVNAVKGKTLDFYSSLGNILLALKNQAPSAQLNIDEVIPEKTLSDTNSLGIKELIAVGESDFRGSPKNRLHNIKIGVKQMQGVIIKPGEEFSFNHYLGPVEAEQGFLPELVIKRTGTVPELGGGLCQVSSTTFRAAMNAGLPITQRKNHAYAVQYYSPQGTDATIYPGVVDLKFINDTPGHILIWPYFKDNTKLIFEFYGTKDNRKVTLEKPLQYDRKSDGSMKAEWTRVVENNGVIATSTFKSIYLPPALFHKEETFPTTTPNTN